MNKLIAIPALLVATPVLAHPGHGLSEFAHGFIHGEHLLILALAAGIGWWMMRRNDSDS